MEWLQLKSRKARQPFHVALCLKFEGELDEEALEMCLNDIIDRHEALRSGFTDITNMSPAEEARIICALNREDGWRAMVFKRYRRRTARLRIARKTINCRISVSEPMFVQAVVSEIIRPFNYSTPPLLRAVCVKGTDAIGLVVALSHLVADGLSVRMFETELRTLYLMRKSPVASEKAIPYSRFVWWQRSLMDTRKHHVRLVQRQTQHATWTDWQLCSAELGALQGTPDTTSSIGLESVDCSIALSRTIQTACGRYQISAYGLFVAALFAICRLRVTRDELAVWTVLANRVMTESERMIGWCSERRLIGLKVDPSASLESLTGRVRTALSSIMDDQYLAAGAIEHSEWRRPKRLRVDRSPAVSIDVSDRSRSEPVRFGPELVATRISLPFTPRETVRVVLRLASPISIDCFFPVQIARYNVRELLCSLVGAVSYIADRPIERVASVERVANMQSVITSAGQLIPE